jgi:hypothetical protein
VLAWIDITGKGTTQHSDKDLKEKP